LNKNAAQHWIDSAGADLRSIEHMIDDEFLTHIVAFHAQQCVEKCFKALLEYHSEKVPKEHSTLKLYGMVNEYLEEPLDKDMLTDFDDLYIEARYPGDLGLLPDGKPTRTEAEEFYQFAKARFYEVSSNLGMSKDC